MANQKRCLDAHLAQLISTPDVDIDDKRLSEKAVAFFRDSASVDCDLMVPQFFWVQVESLFQRRRLMPADEGGLDAEEIARAIVWLRQCTQTTPDDSLFLRARSLAQDLHRPHIYETIYMALAQMNNCDLWTGDEELVKGVGGKLPFVKFIGDYY